MWINITRVKWGYLGEMKFGELKLNIDVIVRLLLALT